MRFHCRKIWFVPSCPVHSASPAKVSHVLCTNALSDRYSLNEYSAYHLIATESPYQMSHLHKSGKSVVFCWILGHSGLPGNEAPVPLHRPLDMGPWHPIRVSALIFAPSSIALSYPLDKAIGPILRAARSFKAGLKFNLHGTLSNML
jgi:hypothetical protein